MKRSWLAGPILERRDWTDALATFRIGVDLGPFDPGQWVEMSAEGPEGVSRALSIASPPGVPPEFFIALVPEGQLTPAVWRLREGDTVWLRAPAVGKFTLDRVGPGGTLWLVSTGTGLAPYIALLRHGSPFDRFERAVVVHGVRHRADLAYRDELESLARTSGGRVRYVPLVSREPPGPGAVPGRVTTALLSGDLERAAAHPLADGDAQVMLCGNPDMVEEMLTLLAARGLEKHLTHKPGRVHVEAYW